jgi:CRISPR-associated protein Csb1
MTDIAQFDKWLTTDAIAALVIREYLMPVEGTDGVLFPATYAAGDSFAGGYNIDPPEGDKNVCLVDSVGSQANRMEPIFAKPEYKQLIPQVIVRAGDKEVSLLEAGHRAGDALVRCTSLQDTLEAAFKAVLEGNFQPMAKIAPTSLVFGAWDSRNTQAKLPRLVASTIRAFDVKKLRRSAQYTPALAYTEDGLLDEPGDLKDADGRVRTKHPFAQRGFVHVPATGTPGGVIAMGGVRRDATLSLAALRLLHSSDKEATVSLRRYILGLSLVAFTANASTYLRQGCNLVPDVNKPREFVIVHADGTREPATVSHTAAMAFALASASAFGVGKDLTVEFDKDLAKTDVTGDRDAKKKGKKEKKADTTAPSTEAK